MNNRFVVIDCKEFKYKVFERNKCVAEFVVENKVTLDAETLENMRTANYTVA